MVVIRHPIEFTLLSGLGSLFVYIGILFMVLMTVSISYVLMEQLHILSELASPIYPLAVLFLPINLIDRRFDRLCGF